MNWGLRPETKLDIQGGSLGHLGQTNIVLLSVNHCNSAEDQRGVGWEDPVYIWELRVVQVEKEHFANKIVLNISISMCLHGFAYKVACSLCQWLEPPVPATGKGQGW